MDTDRDHEFVPRMKRTANFGGKKRNGFLRGLRCHRSSQYPVYILVSMITWCMRPVRNSSYACTQAETVPYTHTHTHTQLYIIVYIGLMERFSPAIVTVVASYHDIRCLDIVYTFSLTERFSPAMVTVVACLYQLIPCCQTLYRHPCFCFFFCVYCVLLFFCACGCSLHEPGAAGGSMAVRGIRALTKGARLQHGGEEAGQPRRPFKERVRPVRSG